MEKIDYQDFKQKLIESTKMAYNNYIREYNGMLLSGFALYSDESAMSISVSMNTYEYLKDNIDEDPGYDSYFRFTPGEWKFEFYHEELFVELNNLLEKWNEDISSRNWNKHQNTIYNIAVDVLSELKIDGYFNNQNNDFVLMFAISDYSNPKKEIDFVKKLNSPEIANKFEEWILTEEND